MSPYRIVILSAGDINAASARLRCFFLGQKLKELGAEVWINEAPAQTDIVFVQKRINAQILNYVSIAKQRGAIIIYDLDDYGPALAWLNIDPEVEKRFLSLCDIITTDTQARCDYLSSDLKYKDVGAKRVIPDPIDYMLEPRSQPVQMSTHAWRGAWFGNYVNIIPAAPYLQMLPSDSALAAFDVFTNAQSLMAIKEKFPTFGYHAWELETFVHNLSTYDFTVLIHNQDIEGEQKSNNKMLVSLALGIPPFVSNTAAYRDTAHAIGLPELIVKSPHELAHKLSSQDLIMELRHRLRDAQCLDYLDALSATQVALKFNDEVRKFFRPQLP